MHNVTTKNQMKYSQEKGDSKPPLISVIVPVYDVERYLDKCLESILAQTYKNFELLLIDDCSPDKCGEICDRYAEMDERVRVIHQENQGLSAARNTGLDAASGEYVFFVDSDDSVGPDFLSSAMEAAIRQKADIVCFGYRVFNNRGRLRNTCGFSQEELITNEQAALLLLRGNIAIDIWVKAIKRELFAGMRFPVGRLSECGLLVPQIFDKAQRIVLSPVVTYNHLYPRKGSICTELSAKYREDGRFMQAAQFNYIAKAHPRLIPAVKDEEFALDLINAIRDFCCFSEKGSEQHNKQAGFFRNDVKKALHNCRVPLYYKVWVLLFSISPKLAVAIFKLHDNKRKRRINKESE